MGLKWTKKDIRSLCGHLDTFMLRNRPLNDSATAHNDAHKEVSTFLGLSMEGWPDTAKAQAVRHRTDVVLYGIREFMFMESDRYSKVCECIGNELVRFSNGEHTEQTRKWLLEAKEYDKDRAKLETMLHRILNEGLPPEVLEYNPYTDR